MINKKILISIAVIGGLSTLVAFSAYGVQKAYAESQSYPPLVQRLIDKFNLDTSQVDQVVSDFRTERQTQNRQNLEERLTNEVEKGNLTEDQKSKILAKVEELQSQRLSDQNLTQDEKRQKMQEHREELQTWAEENDIDLKYVMPMGKRGFGMGPKNGEFEGFQGMRD